MKVKKLVNASSAAGPTNSAELLPERTFNDQGLVQFGANAAGNFSLAIQGRVANDAACPWYTIVTYTQANLVGTPPDATFAALIQLYPFMRARLTVSSGSPAVSCWIGA